MIASPVPVLASPTAATQTQPEKSPFEDEALPQGLELWSTTEGPRAKRRRIENDWADTEGYAFGNVDPFLSPATASSWPFDEFAHDPDYLASQEILRSLLFTTARSAAPTRAGTPDEGTESSGGINIKQVLSVGRRGHHMKNYMAQVAPWVSALNMNTRTIAD
jgi:hypothetical protein